MGSSVLPLISPLPLSPLSLFPLAPLSLLSPLSTPSLTPTGLMLGGEHVDLQLLKLADCGIAGTRVHPAVLVDQLGERAPHVVGERLNLVFHLGEHCGRVQLRGDVGIGLIAVQCPGNRAALILQLRSGGEGGGARGQCVPLHAQGIIPGNGTCERGGVPVRAAPVVAHAGLEIVRGAHEGLPHAPAALVTRACTHPQHVVVPGRVGGFRGHVNQGVRAKHRVEQRANETGQRAGLPCLGVQLGPGAVARDVGAQVLGLLVLPDGSGQMGRIQQLVHVVVLVAEVHLQAGVGLNDHGIASVVVRLGHVDAEGEDTTVAEGGRYKVKPALLLIALCPSGEHRRSIAQAALGHARLVGGGALQECTQVPPVLRVQAAEGAALSTLVAHVVVEILTRAHGLRVS